MSNKQLDILLVEDNKIDRMAIERLIKKENLPYNLIPAETITDAIMLLNCGDFDLALIDHKLPDGTGLDAQAHAGNVPCIFITGSTDQSIVVEAMKAGAYDFITKDSYGNYLQMLPSIIQNALQNSQAQSKIERQQHILNNLGEIVLLIDDNGDVIYINAAVEHLLGYSPGEILESAWWELMSINRAKQNEIRARARGELPPANYDLALPHKNGNKVWISWTESRDPQGRLVCVGRDITERKQAEDEIRRLSSGVEAAGECIVMTDIDGIILYVNPAFTRLTGYSSKEAIGRNPHVLQSGKHNLKFYKSMWTTILSGKVWTGELVNRRKDGSFYDAKLTIAPVFDRVQKVKGFVAVQSNITKRKQVEVELQKAKENAETANRAKSTFLANMSHELRTPLNGILGYAQILKQNGNLTKKQIDGINVIHRSGEHLLMMINDILDLSKIEASKMDVVPGEFHLADFLKIIAEIIQVRAEQKGVIFNFVTLTPLPTVIYTDELRIRQVLLNLLSNAVKFTKKGGTVTLTVKVLDNKEHKPSNSNKQKPSSDLYSMFLTSKVRFEVKDTGLGIPPDKMKSIFLPFHQVGDRRIQEEGTGLGLAISRKLVDMLDGELQAESVENEGSVFWFDINLPEVTIITDKPNINTKSIMGYKGDKQKVLIIDDKAQNRLVLRDLLLPLGFEILEAYDGNDALNKIAEFKPALVLTDLVMYELDGYETTRRIRQIPKLHDVVIIAISASVSSNARQNSLAAGCNDYITKPFQISDLLEKMQTHLNLEWIYNETEITTAKVKEEPIIIPPTKEELSSLYELVLDGDIYGIQKNVQTIMDSDAKSIPFANKISQLTDDFRLDEIQKLIEQYIGDNK